MSTVDGAAPLAARCTSSRVMTPPSALPASACRSTPRSFASFRTGGFAIGTWPPRGLAGSATGAGAGEDGGAAAAAVGGAAPLRVRRWVSADVYLYLTRGFIFLWV